MENQDKIFFNSEGNKWYERNKHALRQTDQDPILYLMELYDLTPKKVLEIGAANGYRLAEIHEKYKAEVYGLEPSDEAIKEGKGKWPFINFQKNIAAGMKYNRDFFDLIIVGGVFNWIDRSSLLISAAKIDEVLKLSGELIIGDFQIPMFFKRRYGHIKDKEVYTYKADYKKIFLSIGFYKEVATLAKDREQNTFSVDSSFDNWYGISLLKKEDVYIER